jgi:CheY-like chemotaxis protein
MRPKKRILLAASLEDRLSTLRFLLETHAYAVTGAATQAEALALLTDKPFDLVLVDWPFDGCERLLNAAHARETVSLALASREAAAPELPADGVITKSGSSSFALLDRVKFAAIRKRGPKKRPVAAALASETMREVCA